MIITVALALTVLSGLCYMQMRPGVQPVPSPTAASAETAAPTHLPVTATPTPLPTPEPTPEYFTISMVGDCTLSSSQYNDHFEQALNGDMSWPFSGTIQYFENDYLTIANLECSFSDNPLAGTGTFQFLGPVSHGEILTSGGVDFVTLSNNHTADFGAAGLEDTKSALDDWGVAWAGPDETFVYTVGNGIRIGLYSARWIATQDEVVAGVSSLKERGDIDLIIVLMHWGLEGSYQVTGGQAQLGQAAVDAGAHLVYGSHPHVLQRIETYNDGYIFYSLGNWSFGGNTAPRDRDTAIVQVNVRRDPDGAVTLEGYNAIPCCLSSTPRTNDYRPEPYPEDSDEWKRTMSKLDGTWTGPDLVVDYSAYHRK